MLAAPISWRVTLGLLVAGIVLLFGSAASAQVSFYGAPPPAEVDPGGGGEGAGEDLGDALGGFFGRNPFSVNFAVRQGYDSNTNTSKYNPESSWYTNISAGASYAFGSPRLQLGASIGGGVTWYYTRPDDPVDFNGSVGVSATYLATPRLTLSLTTNTAYLSQPDLTIIGGTNRQDGDYLYTNTTISAAYQWSDIISTISSYNFTAFYYLDNGVNQGQGNISQTFAQSINWLWKPKTTLVGEYRINTINYYYADMSQIGNYFLVGFDHIFNPRFFWNVRVGAQVNFNDNPIDGTSTYVGPFMESTLRYQFAPNSSLSWNMRYGTEVSGINDVTQRQTFRTGLNLTYGFTPRLSATAGVNYQCNYYNQDEVITPFTENIVSFSAGLNYKLTRWASLQAGYQFTIDIAPEDTGREYTRSIAFVGAGVSF